MEEKKRYSVDVTFTTTMNMVVYATDPDDARSYAEFEASKEFCDILGQGQYFASDFDCEAQTPSEV